MRDPRPLGVKWIAVILGIIALLGMLGARSSHAWSLLPREGVLLYPGIDAVGYLTTQDPRGLGQVVTTRAEKSVLIGEGVVVYVNVGTQHGVRVGDQLLAFSVHQPRELRGLQVVKIEGRLRVLEANETESETLIEEAWRDVALGSRVDFYHPLKPEIPLTPAPETLGGMIIGNYEAQVSYGMGDIAFLNIGTTSGVAPGQCFEIYRVPMEGHRAAARTPEHLTTVVGEVVVLRVQETTAAALVTTSLLPLEAGERVRAGCAWERQMVAEAKETPPPPPAPAPPAAPGAEEALRAAREAFENADIHFAFDSYALSGEAQGTLQEKAKFLHEHPEIQVLIEGHCDERGTEQYNLALGDRRAHAARQYIMGLGVPEPRMRTVSYGEERPLDPGHDEAAWARNRRAHFVIQGP